ncbi:putative 2-dehydropantoate 2-reductase family protein [Aspergillus bombycis]|uniref:Putative 2-dehydropantoate 2-reductase family protein n=1 Tax=Aspergillus bombycis TaxID=109264 RepID=A0A1F8A068_9EURO|nr:putative 2-dehydropantoate 2-reductase family protein [Aspergillus bombycis]OGM45122.1 putative 2-dehydropantoate 2-reductase family protein [Aspergillus bombycis]
MPDLNRILLVGSGGVGTMVAFNIEASGLGRVAAVLRSNYTKVLQEGFEIDSCEHGPIKGWRPSEVLKEIPTITDIPWDYIVVVTKNVPDIPPTVTDMIAPAVTPGHTAILLIQNGLNIERPILERFPNNVCLSGISMIGSQEESPGVIKHYDVDVLILGAFRNPNISRDREVASAKRFVGMYTAQCETRCRYVEDVQHSRWEKLVYNTCWNSICTLTDMDTGRIRLTDHAVQTLVRPAMEEIRAAARVHGVNLPAELCDRMLELDPLTMYYQPSMLVDMRKGKFIEVENLIGEPLAAGTTSGVPMPTLNVLYNLLKAKQWATKEKLGMLEIPPGGDYLTQRSFPKHKVHTRPVEEPSL